MFVDKHGTRLEVITLDRGHGPKPYIRVTRGPFLLGHGYYRHADQALTHVDTESLVEVLTHPATTTP